MVKLSFKTELTLDVYLKPKLAVLKIQDQEISNYVFEEYINYSQDGKIRFFGVDGKETATVSYDCARIW